SRAPTATSARRSTLWQREIRCACGCATVAPEPLLGRSNVPEGEGSLDKALVRLEEIADKLEDPALDLDEAVRLYEEGLRLYGECAKRLDAADLRITQLADALAKQARERGLLGRHRCVGSWTTRAGNADIGDRERHRHVGHGTARAQCVGQRPVNCPDGKEATVACDEALDIQRAAERARAV